MKIERLGAKGELTDFQSIGLHECFEYVDLIYYKTRGYRNAFNLNTGRACRFRDDEAVINFKCKLVEIP